MDRKLDRWPGREDRASKINCIGHFIGCWSPYEDCPNVLSNDLNVFLALRLITADGAEFLFAVETSQAKMLDWVERINFRARLAPVDQLLSFSAARPVRVIHITSGSERNSKTNLIFRSDSKKSASPEFTRNQTEIQTKMVFLNWFYQLRQF